MQRIQTMSESDSIFPDKGSVRETVPAPQPTLDCKLQQSFSPNIITYSDPSDTKQRCQESKINSHKDCDHWPDQLVPSTEQSENRHQRNSNHLIDGANQPQITCCSELARNHNHEQNHHDASLTQQTPLASPSSPSTAVEFPRSGADGSIITNRSMPYHDEEKLIVDDGQSYPLLEHPSTVLDTSTETASANLPPTTTTSSKPKTKLNETDADQYNNKVHQEQWVTNVSEQHHSLSRMQSHERRKSQRQRRITRKFQKPHSAELTSTPAPEIKIGQRVAYKEYYGSEFGTVRWIGRVPQISPDWTVGVEFDNAIGEGDGSLNGRRYFISKDCFAKFLPLDHVALVDQHVGRPEPGTMISVMSASVRPGQMISIQRVSTVHVQHCFLNAPHRRPGAEFLAVNTRLHCQCSNCGPCAHVVKPPRTERLRTGKNATHMCQFSTYTCCGMESQEKALCTYTGNKISSTPPPLNYPLSLHNTGFPPDGNGCSQGSGCLTHSQAQQGDLAPGEGLQSSAPGDIDFLKSTSSKASACRDDRKYNPSIDPKNNQRGISRNSSPVPSKSDAVHQRKYQLGQDEGSNKKEAPSPCDGHNGRDHESSSPIYTNLSQYVSGNCNDVNCCRMAATIEQANRAVARPESNVESHASSNELTMENFGKPAPFLGTDYSASKNLELVDTESGPEKALVASTMTSVRDVNETGANRQQHPGELGDDSERPKTTKVLHRDSIENRYLFPTDDIIDSTLEADLENLSQARYGQYTGARQNGSTKNILKGLRFLVSCLSAKSNHSEFESRSENTLRIFEKPTNEVNNSKPIRDDEMEPCHACSHCESDISQFACYQGKQKFHLEHYVVVKPEDVPALPVAAPAPPVSDEGDPFRFQKKNPAFKNSLSSTGRVSRNLLHRHERNQLSHCCCNCQNFRHGNGRVHGLSISNNSSFHKRIHGSSGSSGSYGCQSICGDFMNGQIKAQTTTTMRTTTVKQFRQASSSSDCGFSSASQNSENLAPSPPSMSPITNAEYEQRCIDQIYKKIAINLKDSAAPMTGEDLVKLRSAFFEVHPKSCCLHTSHSDTFNQMQAPSSSGTKRSQISAYMVGEKHANSPLHQQQHQTQSVRSLEVGNDVTTDCGINLNEDPGATGDKWIGEANQGGTLFENLLQNKSIKQESKLTATAPGERKMALNVDGPSVTCAPDETEE